MNEGLPRRRRRTPALLLLLCIVLAGAIYVEAAQPSAPEAAAVTAASAVPERNRPQDPSFSMPPLSTYAEVVSRPLFTSTRRPSTDASTSDRQTAFILIGIVISPAERHALVSHGAPPHVERLAEGQNLEGWTIKEILPDRIVIAQGDNELDVKPAATPTPPAGGGAVAGQRCAPMLQPPQPATSPLRPLNRGNFNNR